MSEEKKPEAFTAWIAWNPLFHSPVYDTEREAHMYIAGLMNWSMRFQLDDLDDPLFSLDLLRQHSGGVSGWRVCEVEVRPK